MSTISVYAFETHGDESATEWTTQDFQEAVDYARENGYSLIEREYEYTDSTLVEDFRPGHALDGSFINDHVCGVDADDPTNPRFFGGPDVGFSDEPGESYEP